MAYDWKKTVIKGLVQLGIFGIPLLVTTILQWHPEIATLTIGSLATMLINYLKNKK